MKNLTLAVHDDFLDRVRVIAAERKTTVNGLVREYLGKLANEEARLADTRKRLRELMDNSTAELGPDYVWDRGEIYADRMFPRHEHRDLRGGRKRHEPAKHEIARHIIPGTRFCLSGQVLAEFYVNVTTKPRIRLTLPEIDEWLDLLDRYPVAAVDAALVRRGVFFAQRFKLDYFDAALIAAAERLGAPILYTEDLNHNQLYGSVRVMNPFRPN
jgi:predicted nucleic acid-binding protein